MVDEGAVAVSTEALAEWQVLGVTTGAPPGGSCACFGGAALAHIYIVLVVIPCELAHLPTHLQPVLLFTPTATAAPTAVAARVVVLLVTN